MALKVFLVAIFIAALILYVLAVIITQPVLVTIGAFIALVAAVAAMCTKAIPREATR